MPVRVRVSPSILVREPKGFVNEFARVVIGVIHCLTIFRAFNRPGAAVMENRLSISRVGLSYRPGPLGSSVSHVRRAAGTAPVFPGAPTMTQVPKRSLARGVRFRVEHR